MITYPAFNAALDGRDVHDIARASGVPAAEILAIAAGGWAAPVHHRAPLAAALDADPDELFAAESAPHDVDLEPALAARPTRHVTDPTTLRNIDSRPR